MLKETYQEYRLKDITTKIGSGATPKGGHESYKEEGIPSIRSLNVYDDGFRKSGLAYLDDLQAKKLSNVTVQENDILLNITGASVARCCIVPSDFVPARVNQHVSIIRVKSELVDSKFLSVLLTSKTYKDLLLHHGEAGSTRQAITKLQLEEFVISLPSLPEQKRIVAILDEAFANISQAVANAKKNLANARELFDSYLNEVFASSDERVKLSEITTVISDGDHLPPPKAQEGIPFITISNVNKNTRLIDFSDTFKVPKSYFNALKDSRKPFFGDILYTVTGSYGIPIKVPQGVEFCFQRHIGLLRPKKNINSSWLYYALLSPSVYEQASSGATGTAQKTVSLSVLRNIDVSMMSESKQISAVEKLDLFWEQKEQLEDVYRRKLVALAELKQALLQKAFMGELTA